MLPKYRVMMVSWLALTLHVFAPGPTLCQPAYSLDEWMTVSAVTSFTWSPDRATLYFTTNASDSGTTEIFRTSSDGGEPTQLTTNQLGERPEPKQSMVLSADGSTLYYVSARYFQNYTNLFSIASNGGKAREYPDEDHSLRRYKKTVRDRLIRMERFFEKHLRLGWSRSSPRARR